MRILIYILCLSSFLQAAYDDNLLVAVFMVKNEAHCIEDTLLPLVEGGIKQFLIYDTGSTDETIGVAERFFKKHSLDQTYVIQEPFVDFEVSRNRALDLTEELFPDTVFMMMPDAEWYLHKVPDLLHFCQEHKNGCDSVYLMRIISDFYTPRLMRCRTGARFAGDIHESMPASGRVPAHICFELKTTSYGAEKSRQRWVKDKEKLLARYNANPFDTRTLFYLAQTCHCLDELKEAHKWYQMRTMLQGWDEEDFVAKYRLASLIEELSKTDSAYKWQDAQTAYLEAYSMRPSRIEPLVRIAQHYWDKGDHGLCYLFAKIACEIPFPQEDNLMVERYTYEFSRYDILGMAAWYRGKFAVGEWATRKALKVRPDLIHLHRNMKFYIDAKRQKKSPQEENAKRQFTVKVYAQEMDALC